MKMPMFSRVEIDYAVDGEVDYEVYANMNASDRLSDYLYREKNGKRIPREAVDHLTFWCFLDGGWDLDSRGEIRIYPNNPDKHPDLVIYDQRPLDERHREYRERYSGILENPNLLGRPALGGDLTDVPNPGLALFDMTVQEVYRLISSSRVAQESFAEVDDFPEIGGLAES